jgi:hypothetical protein
MDQRGEKGGVDDCIAAQQLFDIEQTTVTAEGNDTAVEDLQTRLAVCGLGLAASRDPPG